MKQTDSVKEMKTITNKEAIALILFMTLVLLMFFGIDAKCQGYTIKKDVLFSTVEGVKGTEYLKADIYKPTVTPKGILVWFHGGGFLQGTKESGNAVLCKFWANNGWLVINTNYRLIDGVALSHADSILSTKLFWEDCYMAIEDGKAAVRYEILTDNLQPDIPVYFGGVSAGGVIADESVCWQPNELGIVDTAKWKNRSNGNLQVNILGSFSISGSVFSLSDVDRTDKIMIRCYGLLDNTLKCNGGINHKCRYEGDCEVTALQQQYSNPDYYLAFPNAAHGLKEGFLNIQGALNIKKSRQFILDTLNAQ